MFGCLWSQLCPGCLSVFVPPPPIICLQISHCTVNCVSTHALSFIELLYHYGCEQPVCQEASSSNPVTPRTHRVIVNPCSVSGCFSLQYGGDNSHLLWRVVVQFQTREWVWNAFSALKYYAHAKCYSLNQVGLHSFLFCFECNAILLTDWLV